MFQCRRPPPPPRLWGCAILSLVFIRGEKIPQPFSKSHLKQRNRNSLVLGWKEKMLVLNSLRMAVCLGETEEWVSLSEEQRDIEFTWERLWHCPHCRKCKS